MSLPRRPSTLLAAALLALSAALALAPGAALAQDPASPHTPSPQEIAIARQTAFEGLTAYQAGEFEKALSLFQQAKAVYPSAQVLRLEGYSLLALEQWEKAADAMDAAIESQIGPLPPADRKDVEEQLAKAMVHLGLVNVSSTVPEAKLSINGGAPLALPLNKPIRMLAGKHKLVVSAPEHDDVLEEVTLEGGGKTLEVTLNPAPKKKDEPPPPPPKLPPPPPPKKPGWFPMQRPIGFAAAGAGVALGGAALVTGLVSAHIRGNVEEDYGLHKQNFGESCDKGDYRLCVFDRAVINNDADRADGLRDATVGLVVTASVLVAGGVALIVFAGDGSDEKASPKTGHASERGGPSGGARKTEAKGHVACGLSASPGFACAGTF